MMASNDLSPTPSRAVIELFGDKLVDLISPDVGILRTEPICLSTAYLYSAPKLQARLESQGIHEFANHMQGPIALDSGGFQNLRALQKGKTTHAFTIEEMIAIYRKAQLRQGDCCVSLDIPITPDVPIEQQYDAIKRSNENFKQTLALAPDLDKFLVPVLHGWNNATTKMSLEAASNRPLVAIGAFFPLFFSHWDKELMAKFRRIIELTRNNKDFEDTKFWGLGANGANPLHLCAFAGVTQTDSTAWRIKAMNYKIVFNPLDLDGSYRYEKITEISTSKFVDRWTDLHDHYLSQCQCPVCSGLNLQERKIALGEGKTAGWIKRCIHNAYAYVGEKILANELCGTIGYYRYLLKRFAHNKIYLQFLKVVREMGEPRNQIEPIHRLRETNHQSTLDRYTKDRLI